MMLKVIFHGDPQTDHIFDERKMLKMPTSGGPLIAIPWINRSVAGNDFFIDLGERAIAWWHAFTPSNAIPMDKNGNPA